MLSQWCTVVWRIQRRSTQGDSGNQRCHFSSFGFYFNWCFICFVLLNHKSSVDVTGEIKFSTKLGHRLQVGGNVSYGRKGKKESGKGGEAARGETFPFSPSHSVFTGDGLWQVFACHGKGKWACELHHRGAFCWPCRKVPCEISTQVSQELGHRVPLEAARCFKYHVECLRIHRILGVRGDPFLVLPDFYRV